MPNGYRRHDRRSPLTDPWEPLFARETADAVHLGLHIREVHCNSRGFAHGGLISSLADNSMGLSAVRTARRHPDAEEITAVTAALTLDFIETVRMGEFIEFHPTILKAGRLLVFADCRVISNEQIVARASATFRIVQLRAGAKDETATGPST